MVIPWELFQYFPDSLYMGVYLFTGIVIRRPKPLFDFFASYTLTIPLIK